jgi:hypothetical protein
MPSRSGRTIEQPLYAPSSPDDGRPGASQHQPSRRLMLLQELGAFIETRLQHRNPPAPMMAPQPSPSIGRSASGDYYEPILHRGFVASASREASREKHNGSGTIDSFRTVDPAGHGTQPAPAAPHTAASVLRKVVMAPPQSPDAVAPEATPRFETVDAHAAAASATMATMTTTRNPSSHASVEPSPPATQHKYEVLLAPGSSSDRTDSRQPSASADVIRRPATRPPTRSPSPQDPAVPIERIPHHEPSQQLAGPRLWRHGLPPAPVPTPTKTAGPMKDNSPPTLHDTNRSQNATSSDAPAFEIASPVADELNALRAENEELRGANTQALRDASALAAEVGRLEAQLAKSNSTVETLENTLGELRAQRDEATAETDALRTERDGAIKQLSWYTARERELSEQLENVRADLKSTLDAGQTEATMMQRMIDVLSAEVQMLREKCSSAGCDEGNESRFEEVSELRLDAPTVRAFDEPVVALKGRDDNAYATTANVSTEHFTSPLLAHVTPPTLLSDGPSPSREGRNDVENPLLPPVLHIDLSPIPARADPAIVTHPVSPPQADLLSDSNTPGYNRQPSSNVFSPSSAADNRSFTQALFVPKGTQTLVVRCAHALTMTEPVEVPSSFTTPAKGGGVDPTDFRDAAELSPGFGDFASPNTRQKQAIDARALMDDLIGTKSELADTRVKLEEATAQWAKWVDQCSKIKSVLVAERRSREEEEARCARFQQQVDSLITKVSEMERSTVSMGTAAGQLAPDGYHTAAELRAAVEAAREDGLLLATDVAEFCMKVLDEVRTGRREL